MKTRLLLALGVCGLGASGSFAAACGSDSNVTIPGGGDASSDGSSIDGTSGNQGNVDGGGNTDGGSTMDAAMAVPCAPPADPTKAALCLSIDHETIDFLANDPRLDGLGAVIAQVFADAVPDYADGGEEPALAQTVLPQNDAGVADAGQFDLHDAIPIIRFELPPGTVYPRVFFIDNPTLILGPGWWVAGLDFSGGLKDGLPLASANLVAGKGTGVSMSLTALRALRVTMTRSVKPEGDGQGTAAILALDSNQYTTATKGFGVATGCADLSQDDASAELTGFVIGKGPYFLSAELDDFGIGDAGNAGFMVSLDDAGHIPSANKVTYPAASYVVSHAVDLNFVFAKPNGADKKSCP